MTIHILKPYAPSMQMIYYQPLSQRLAGQIVLIAHQHLCQAFMEKDILPLFASWEAAKSSKSAMFRSLMNYLHRVETIMLFVAASRNCDLSLHLEAGRALSKLFFAFDGLKYKRL